MANYKGHIAGAVVCSGAYAAALMFAPVVAFAEAANILHGWQALAALFVLGILFGLFPDIDTNSKGQDIFYGGAFLLDVALILDGQLEAAAYLGLIAMAPVLSKHRGWTHTYWAMVLVPLPILLVPSIFQESNQPAAWVYYGAAVVGYFSHLLLDGKVNKRFRVKN